MREAHDLCCCPLEALSEAQLAALGQLKITPHQEVLGRSFSESLEDCRNGPPESVLGLCLLEGEQPVGIAIFKGPLFAPDWAPPHSASIHGLKIALPWQGRGWGHIAFRLAVEKMREAWPDIRNLVLAVDAENTPALAIYRQFGMSDSGPVFDGPNGAEHRMRISLAGL